ncbi:MAG: hypothetical protein JNK49_18305, partial [Planctomycetes bacterium]|nr:hypothetical protein [Planctomycetota bacterium]
YFPLMDDSVRIELCKARQQSDRLSPTTWPSMAAASGVVEVNLERDPRWARIFTGGDLRRMLADLEAVIGRPITAHRSLLFLCSSTRRRRSPKCWGHCVGLPRRCLTSRWSLRAACSFMFERGLPLALRVDANPPSIQDLAVKTALGDAVRYRILNLPGYLVWRAAELLELALPSSAA